MHELESALAQVRDAWIAGRSAIDQAPSSWRDAAGEDELALLALAGHASDTVTRRVPGAAFVERSLLPPLSAPLVPDTLRPRFRRLLAGPKNLPSLERPLITFLSARGFAAHPADWMPDAKDDWAPDLYAPWLDWVRADVNAADNAEISAETYEQWSWTERRKALEELRASDPAAALAIIAAKAGGEPAERRMRLIELLQIGLSEADAEYLEGLSKDRSDRVQALARALLARLGRATDTCALATELAAMVEVNTVGLIKRRIQLVLKPLKTGAQAMRRRQLFSLVSLAALARALGVTEQQLVESAPEGVLEEVDAFVTMVATSGSDASCEALLQSMLDDAKTSFAYACPLAPRLSMERRRMASVLALKRDNDSFDTTLAFAGAALGVAPYDALLASPGYGCIRAAVEGSLAVQGSARAQFEQALNLSLPRIGLLLDAPGARALLEQITAWGLSPAEPRLDMLHFNAALAPETAT
jgi:hypothetical protein